jgi:energy-coupling factor transport system permease protein
VLSVHAGDIILFSLPRSWPIIGGPITLEALLYGLSSGASLFAVLLVFAAFNLAVEANRLLRWIPAGLYQAGLIVSIALAFVPQMMASLRDIREAQRIRGYVFRSLRDLVHLFVPLITTGLERSLILAESMEARGFGGIAREAPLSGHNWPRIAALAGLLMVLLSLLWPALGLRPAWDSLLLSGLGLALTLLSIWGRGRQVKRTHYHHEHWRREDTLVTVACAVSLALALLARTSSSGALAYYPYPPLSPWPGFAPTVGLAAVLLAAPGFVPQASASETGRAVEET